MHEIPQRLTELEGRIAAALRQADERRTLSIQQQESCIDVEVELAGTFGDFLEQMQRDLRQILQLIAKEDAFSIRERVEWLSRPIGDGYLQGTISAIGASKIKIKIQSPKTGEWKEKWVEPRCLKKVETVNAQEQ